MATPIHCIGGKKLKSCRTVKPITKGIYHTMSCHWLIMSSGVDAQTCIQMLWTKAISRKQVWSSMQPADKWLKMICDIQ